MCHERSVTAISWIPSEAVTGLPKLPFEVGVGHYDEPPPDHLGAHEIDRIRESDRFCEANFLRAWIDVEDGRIVDHGLRRRARRLDDVSLRPEVDPPPRCRNRNAAARARSA
jgi:hypothetical protein